MGNFNKPPKNGDHRVNEAGDLQEFRYGRWCNVEHDETEERLK